MQTFKNFIRFVLLGFGTGCATFYAFFWLYRSEDLMAAAQLSGIIGALFFGLVQLTPFARWLRYLTLIIGTMAAAGLLFVCITMHLRTNRLEIWGPLISGLGFFLGIAACRLDRKNQKQGIKLEKSPLFKSVVLGFLTGSAIFYATFWIFFLSESDADSVTTGILGAILYSVIHLTPFAPWLRPLTIVLWTMVGVGFVSLNLLVSIEPKNVATVGPIVSALGFFLGIIAYQIDAKKQKRKKNALPRN